MVSLNELFNHIKSTFKKNFEFLRYSLIKINYKHPCLIVNNANPKKKSVLLKRYSYYFPEIPIRKKSLLKGLLSRDNLLVYDTNPKIIRLITIFRGGIFNVDYEQNPYDIWHWNNALFQYYCGEKCPSDKKKFEIYITDLVKNQYDKCYIFGTGPSLEKAADIDWSDGYRIVCNTIVKDKELWNRINPHIVVAADALYHFCDSTHAKLFRKDLHDRLGETNTVFMYPSPYHPIVIREFFDYADRLYPIPQEGPDFFYSLINDFRLPSGQANVLTIMLIPLACTISKNIFLWGFDGRAPNDSFFWKYSQKQSYSDEIPVLKNEHPAFFNFLIPDEDPTKYVKTVHGDRLDYDLMTLERQGYKIRMMHKSWTPTFQKRYIDEGKIIIDFNR